MSLFAVKPMSRITAESGGTENKLVRSLGPVNLVALGIGAIIGAGLFSLTGIVAANNAGPSVVISFVVAAIGCAFAGMCYSEFATMIPIAGSAYTYAYATMGEFFAWIIGWDLVLEYALGAATVSVSWSQHVVELLANFGIHLPVAITNCPFDTVPGIINLPAIFIILCMSGLLIIGISESAQANNVIVLLKLSIVVIFIAVGFGYINQANYHPFIPPNTGEVGHFGWSGILRGAGIVFFAFIGFDAVSTAAQEAKNPQRTMPIGIIGSLAVCTILYVLFSYVMTGMVNYKLFAGDSAPVLRAIKATPFAWLETAVGLGIIAGYSSVILVMLLGQSRVFFSMSRDGLLPKTFSSVHPRFHTPWKCNLVFMIFVSIFSGLLPISALGNMVSIGTLLAFVIVCGAVMIMRKTHPHIERPFRTPLVPFVPIMGILVCLTMMVFLDKDTWIRLVVWLAIGFAVYFGYSRYHSHLRPTATK